MSPINGEEAAGYEMLGGRRSVPPKRYQAGEVKVSHRRGRAKGNNRKTKTKALVKEPNCASNGSKTQTRPQQRRKNARRQMEEFDSGSPEAWQAALTNRMAEGLDGINKNLRRILLRQDKKLAGCEKRVGKLENLGKEHNVRLKRLERQILRTGGRASGSS